MSNTDMSQASMRQSSISLNVGEEHVAIEDVGTLNSVTKELNRHYLGTLSLFRNQVDTDWGSSSKVRNRSMNRKGVDKLKERFSENLDLLNPKHHMSATVDKRNAEKLLLAMKKSRCEWADISEDFESLKRRLILENDLAIYPIVDVEVWNEADCECLTLQAGQHRYAALEETIEEEGRRCWPVRIYLTPLSEKSLTRLRENVVEVQLAQSDGERFIQIIQYQHLEAECKGRMEESEVGSEEYTKAQAMATQAREAAEMKKKEFGNGSSSRAKAVLARPKFAEILFNSLSMPALAEDFSFASMGELLALRCQEVRDVDYEVDGSFSRIYSSR
jgi:hypothetical protein